VADWTFPGINALDGETSNANATTPFPLQTFACPGPSTTVQTTSTTTVAGLCGDEFPDMIITGVIDGPLPEGEPKAMELYVVRDIPDLTIWGLELASNGANSTGSPSFTFPSGTAAEGDFIYVATETPNFNAFFGFDPNFTNIVLNINGNDALLLYESNVAVDFFGQAGQDGTGQPWAYTDSWGYRRSVVPSGSGFEVADWTFPGINALDGETSNANAATPFPLQTFTCPSPLPATTSTTTQRCPDGQMCSSLLDMIITGVIDGPLSGGTPKAMELYVVNDIPDLSDWGLQVAFNGNPPSTSFTFPADSATAGDFIYVSFETTNFNAFFGFDPDYTSGVLNVNGDDALLLQESSISVDFFGQVGQDGTGQPWEYRDSWGYRTFYSGVASFNVSDWNFPGPDVLDGASTNADASTPFPVASFCCN